MSVGSGMDIIGLTARRHAALDAWRRGRIGALALLLCGCQLSGPRAPSLGLADSATAMRSPQPTTRVTAGYREVVQADGVVVQVPEAAAIAIERATHQATSNQPQQPKQSITPEVEAPAKPDVADPKPPELPKPKNSENGAKQSAKVKIGSGEGTARDPKVAKYVLQVGDRLEIVYTHSPQTAGDYRLQPGDEIRVEYLHLGLGEVGATGEGRAPASTLDRNLKLQPDGKISLPYLGLVQAADRDVAALTDVLNERYRKFYVDPKMHVTLLSTGSGLDDLREGLRTAGSRLVEVAADGRIALPYVGSIVAADLSIAELQTELTERHKKSRPGTAATVRLVRGAER